MIEGLQLDVPGADIVMHLRKQAQMHVNKAEQYEEQSASVDKLMEGAAQMSGDPRSTFKEKAASHRERADYFRLIAKYMDETEVYRLEMDDLRRLEMVVRAY